MSAAAFDVQAVEQWLTRQGPGHLSVLFRCEHVVVYSEENGEKWNRVAEARHAGHENFRQVPSSPRTSKWTPSVASKSTAAARSGPTWWILRICGRTCLREPCPVPSTVGGAVEARLRDEHPPVEIVDEIE